MKIQNTLYTNSFKSSDSSSEKNLKSEKSFLDKFETGIRNSADMNDTLQVPRTIFKGYLAFMVGTGLASVAMIAKNKFPKLSVALNLSSILLATYGTYSFVRPYLIKNSTKPE